MRFIYMCVSVCVLATVMHAGYDMDYTLVHYNVDAWEGAAFNYSKQYLLADNFPVADFIFDPELVIRYVRAYISVSVHLQ